MDLNESREEWRSSYGESRSTIIQKMYAVCKIHCLFKKKLSVSSCFYSWQENIISHWLECYRGLAKDMKIDYADIDWLSNKVEVMPKSLLYNVFLCIKQIFGSIQEKCENFVADKEKWLISNRVLELFKQLNQSGFIDSISDRVYFWKKSLFPDIHIEEFWDYIRQLQPSLKLQILESELLNEKNHLEEIENNWKNKIVLLKREEKSHKKKVSEITAYQNYLEQECSEIQKCWIDIRKIADSLETTPQAAAVTRFLNSKTQSFEDLNRFVMDNSIPEMSSSQMELEMSDEDKDNKIVFELSGTKMYIDVRLRFKKTALRTIMKFLTIKKTVWAAKSFDRWKNNTLTPWPTLSKNFSTPHSMLPRLKNKNPNKGLIVMNNRRLVEFEQSSAFFLQQKVFRSLFGKLCRLMFANWKNMLKLKQKNIFLYWKTKIVNNKGKKKAKTLNISSLKVIFFMSVLLGRSISEGKKLVAFQSWRLGLESFRNRARNKELEKVEEKVKENVLKNNALRLEQRLDYEKLKVKLRIMESQIKILKLDGTRIKC